MVYLKGDREPQGLEPREPRVPRRRGRLETTQCIASGDILGLLLLFIARFCCLEIRFTETSVLREIVELQSVPSYLCSSQLESQNNYLIRLDAWSSVKLRRKSFKVGLTHKMLNLKCLKETIKFLTHL